MAMDNVDGDEGCGDYLFGMRMRMGRRVRVRVGMRMRMRMQPCGLVG
jgi:hypothetical protein